MWAQTDEEFSGKCQTRRLDALEQRGMLGIGGEKEGEGRKEGRKEDVEGKKRR